ncbi:hypothetical protein TNCV_1366811 [Trichonephila clavipes]|nr:hypothetical protein TNCV_1366811 [Trichonephila clavipes]
MKYPQSFHIILSDMGWRLASRAICPNISPKTPKAECRKRQRDERAARYQPPRRNAASEYSSSSSPRPGGRHVHFRESTLRDNYAAPRHSQYLSDDGAANIMDEHGQNPHKTWTADREPGV